MEGKTYSESGYYAVLESEFWTSRQRQAHSLHEISYRACFKPQLPAYFIERYSRPGMTVYDPFSGRGTTALEAALRGRKVIANDVNPLSSILARPRLEPPTLQDVQARLDSIDFSAAAPVDPSDPDLSPFYHPRTERQIRALRHYLNQRQQDDAEDAIDRWIRMVATNRLTGHSPGFFSVYTLPPNQAVTPERQRKINERLGQTPPVRDVKALILKKSKQLLSDLIGEDRQRLAASQPLFFSRMAWDTPEIGDNSIALVVTSPPFLDVVNYAQDNWLRCWFNGIDVGAVASKFSMHRSVEAWAADMERVFVELHRVVMPQGIVAFEVGEVRKGSINLEDVVIPVAQRCGFKVKEVLINQQRFTKTSHIWGVANNRGGTNTNRVVTFQKGY